MVLKRISLSDVEIGMFVHAFEGSWLRHPFWRARFLVSDEKTLSALRDSAIDALVIDTDRGRDVGGTAPALNLPPPAPPPVDPARFGRHRRQLPAPPPPQRRTPLPAATQPPPPSGPVAVAREFGNARLIEGRARKVISHTFLEARLGKAPKLDKVVPVVEDVFASIQRNPSAFSGLMRCKSEAEGAYRHMLAVCAMMVSLARRMGLSKTETIEAGTAGLLLDIGISQLSIDLEGYLGRFDQLAFDLLQRHVYVAHDLLVAAGDIPDAVLACVLHHHERLDGSGFPQGLKGREIDQLSRMAAVCDTFDHLVAGAHTGQALDPADALQAMLGEDGEHNRGLDPDILARFVEAVGVYPMGSFVRLRSGRLAMVVDQDREDPALPVVRTFFSTGEARHIPPATIPLARCFGGDAIEGIADLAGYDLPEPALLRDRLMHAAMREG